MVDGSIVVEIVEFDSGRKWKCSLPDGAVISIASIVFSGIVTEGEASGVQRARGQASSFVEATND